MANAKSKVVAGGRAGKKSLFSRFNKWHIVAAVVIFGGIGAYFIMSSSAASSWMIDTKTVTTPKYLLKPKQKAFWTATNNLKGPAEYRACFVLRNEVTGRKNRVGISPGENAGSWKWVNITSTSNTTHCSNSKKVSGTVGSIYPQATQDYSSGTTRNGVYIVKVYVEKLVRR